MDTIRRNGVDKHYKVTAEGLVHLALTTLGEATAREVCTVLHEAWEPGDPVVPLSRVSRVLRGLQLRHVVWGVHRNGETRYRLRAKGKV